MVAVVLAVAGALAYGFSDFLGGVLSRRGSLWPTALTACAGGLIGTTALALAIPGSPHGADFAWAALAGVGNGAGTTFLYRGMAGGRMGVVAPVSAVGAAAIPVLAGVVTGERPGPVVWLGIAVAFPAIWLVAREHGADSGPEASSGAIDGVLAGVGFGVLFAALGQIPSSAGYWPLTLNQAISVLAVVAAASVLSTPVLPRRLADCGGLISGLLATLAVWCFLLANERGLLTVSAVLVSLYPASTVLLAVALLHERIHRPQAAGLLLCGVTVALVAVG